MFKLYFNDPQNGVSIEADNVKDFGVAFELYESRFKSTITNSTEPRLSPDDLAEILYPPQSRRWADHAHVDSDESAAQSTLAHIGSGQSQTTPLSSPVTIRDVCQIDFTQWPAGSEFYVEKNEIPEFSRRYYSLRAALKVIIPSLTAEELSQSETYQMQIAGICAALGGHHQSGDSLDPQYETVALHDACKLYKQYDAMFKILCGLGYERDVINDKWIAPKQPMAYQQQCEFLESELNRATKLWKESVEKRVDLEKEIEHLRRANSTFASQAIDPTEALANTIESNDRFDLNRRNATIVGMLDELATKHGWVGINGQLSPLGQISEWLDLFVKATNELNELKSKHANLEYNYAMALDEGKERSRQSDAIIKQVAIDHDKLLKAHMRLNKKWEKCKKHNDELNATVANYEAERARR